METAMIFGNLFGNRRGVRARSLNWRRICIARATAPVLCENLEARRLLTTYTYTVPSGYTAVYLRATGTPGEVVVRLGSPTGTIGHTFTDTSGNDVIDCASVSNFLFVDRVSAAFKPTGNSDSGIKVQGGSGGTLEIEAGLNDRRMEVTATTSTSATIQVTDNVSEHDD